MAPANRPKTGDKAAKKPGTFTKDDPRINRKGRPKTAQQIRELLRDETLAAVWAERIRTGVENGDVELMKLYGKHAVGTEQEVKLGGNLAVTPVVPALQGCTKEELFKLLEKSK